MSELFPAHIHPDDKRIEQSCTAHSRNTAQYAGNALKSIDLYHSAYLSGLLHDCGKMKESFRNYIRAAADGKKVQRGSVIHTYAGVRYLLNNHAAEPSRYEDIASEILAYAAGAHHGLFDCVNEDHENGFIHRINTIPDGDDVAISNFLSECADAKELDELFHAATNELTSAIDKCDAIAKDYDEVAFLLGSIIRLITSSVMEGDRRDTAEFMNGVVFPEEADRSLWLSLLTRVEAKLNTYSYNTPINLARRNISDICRKAAEAPSGVYRLNVPTGGGKTLSSLRYALAHAYKYGKKRIIITSPLLTITEQNTEEIRKIIGDNDNNIILEHHSNLVRENNFPEELSKHDLLVDSWSSPIIITTLVQLLNTMFDGKTSSVRRFHALTNSVIIIDEVQSVPYKLLTLFNLAITFLSEVCGATVILCSATQPCVEKLRHPILSEIRDIVPYDPDLLKVFKRTDISFAGSFKINEIPDFASEVLNDCTSLLIVCNKKSEAETIFHSMKHDGYNVFHLSAGICAKHRKQTLEDLNSSLDQKDKKTVCVSTQVIEAGVNISFNAVIRLMAGMDSIIQSAGRCNRNGESDTNGHVYVVLPIDETLTNLREIKDASQATHQLLMKYETSPNDIDNDLFSDKAIRFYYKKLFSIHQKSNIFYHDYPTKEHGTLFDLLSLNGRWQKNDENAKIKFLFNQAFSSAGKMFEVFDTNTTDVIVPWGEGENIITELNSNKAKNDIGYVKELLDRSRGYTVSIYDHQLKQLEKNGAIKTLANGAVLGIDPQYYDKNTGIQTNLTKEVHDQCDTLIW